MPYAAENEPVATASLQGHEDWERVKSRLRNRWEALDTDDMTPSMPIRDLIDTIQERTGDARETIETFLAELQEEAKAKFQSVRDRVEPTVAGLSDASRDVAANVADNVKAGYGRSEQYVREQPLKSIAVALGVGIAAGIFLGFGRRR